MANESQYQSLPAGVLAVAVLLAFGIWLPLFVIPPIEDIIGQALAISHTQTALAYSAPVAVLALAAIPGGILADRVGLKKTIGAGAVLLAAGAALRGVSVTFSGLLAFTLLYGLGLGLCFPNLPKLARYCSPRARSSVTVGVFTVAIILSGAISLAITRPVVYRLTGSYEGVLFASSVPAILAAILWWALIKDPPCQAAGVETVRFDLAALRRLIGRADLLLVAVLFLLHNVVLYTWIGWMPAFLVGIGASERTAGLITPVALWVGVPSVVLLSRLSARLERRKPFLWAPSALLVFAAGAVLVVNVPLSWALMFVTGIGTSIRFATILALPVEMVEPGQAGAATGLMMSIGYIGALVGPLAGGYIIDTTGSYDLVFISLAIVSAVTVGVCFMIPETGRAREGP
jgi:MFS transporter, CP family, cyanate transporter